MVYIVLIDDVVVDCVRRVGEISLGNISKKDAVTFATEIVGRSPTDIINRTDFEMASFINWDWRTHVARCVSVCSVGKYGHLNRPCFSLELERTGAAL